MKILWGGNVFNPTGIATAGREMVKALKKAGVEVQVTDPWHDTYDFNEGLSDLNKPINVKDADTIFFDYPNNWKNAHGKIFGGFVHEGTRLFDGWIDALNTAEAVWCPSNAVKNLFKWNGVTKPIYVIPHGVSELYKPSDKPEASEEYLFLSVNSWGGKAGDRKGTDLLIRAFDEEFKDEKVKLLLKVSTFWGKKQDIGKAIHDLLGHTNENIMFNDKYEKEEDLVKYYQNADCFVMPTRAEGFGMTGLNALACGLPLIITKDNNSGQMDYCKGNPAVLFIKTDGMTQADPTFYVEGNMQPIPSLADLRKQMRYAFEHTDLKQIARDNAKNVSEQWSWDNSAKKIIEMIKEIKEVKNGEKG
jgi:glycosyltransferase involved in cell wall biosynthesis